MVYAAPDAELCDRHYAQKGDAGCQYSGRDLGLTDGATLLAHGSSLDCRPRAWDVRLFSLFFLVFFFIFFCSFFFFFFFYFFVSIFLFLFFSFFFLFFFFFIIFFFFFFFFVVFSVLFFFFSFFFFFPTLAISKAATIKDLRVEDFDTHLANECAKSRFSWCSNSCPILGDG